MAETDLEARIDALAGAYAADAAAHKEAMARWALEQAAHRLGAVDPGAVVLLADRSKLERDSSGRVANAGAVVADLLRERPYLAPPPAQTVPAAAPAREIVSPAGSYDAVLEETGVVDALREGGYRAWKAKSRAIEAGYRQHRVDVAKPTPITVDPTAPTFTRSQMRDFAFFQANKAALIAAEREGRIIED